MKVLRRTRAKCTPHAYTVQIKLATCCKTVLAGCSCIFESQPYAEIANGSGLDGVGVTVNEEGGEYGFRRVGLCRLTEKRCKTPPPQIKVGHSWCDGQHPPMPRGPTAEGMNFEGSHHADASV